MSDIKAVHDLFGSFRAEWLREDIFRLFSEPAYFAHLLGNKSCVLMGGRGSGKTTVLRCLSYQGQDALGQQDWSSPNHVGVYYRVNTNIVTAFEGPELSGDEWRRLFGHFLNLTICEELTRYVLWVQKRAQVDSSSISFKSISATLGLDETETAEQLLDEISQATGRLELFINNLGSERPMVSQLQSPITQYLSLLKKLPGHKNVSFHIVLDEYENLLDYQQTVVNTLIKHSGDNCYFKIGVRELGWRVHTTLNDNESLISPADYELIHIEERLKDEFANFARTVCESRLENNSSLVGTHLKLDELLPTLTPLEEAQELGVAKRVDAFRKQMRDTPEVPASAKSQHDFVLYVFYELNSGDFSATVADIVSYANREKKAVDRYHNHSYALLFSIAERGTSITKHYCGHETFAQLANRNIRFYMQLVHESIVQQFTSEKDLSEPIDCRNQTLAARRVGSNYLRELEGATSRGSHLAKMILGFGRFFGILASNPIGSSPEKNQFFLKDFEATSPIEQQSEASKLLTEAIMHLALIRSPGTKLAAETDIRAWDYAPHPVFSPYFNYSSRRKRKIEIHDVDLVGMSKAPQATIKKLLGQSRQHLADTELPPQLSMFDEFFK